MIIIEMTMKADRLSAIILAIDTIRSIVKRNTGHRHSIERRSWRPCIA